MRPHTRRYEPSTAAGRALRAALVLPLAAFAVAACTDEAPFDPEIRAAGQSAQVEATSADIAQFIAQEATGPVVGTSILERGKNGITMRLRIDTDFPGQEGTQAEAGSIRGHAVTIWAIVFNDPSKCTNGPSVYPNADGGFFCFPGPDIGASGGDVVRVTGKVVNQGPEVTFADRIKVGDPGIATGNGLTNPSGAEIHLIVRTHGPHIPGVDQLSSPAAGCVGPDLPRGAIPTQEGQCGDPAAGAHLPVGF